MLEFVLIIFGILALVAFLGAKIGYRKGARAAAEIADVFRQKITSSDNDLKGLSDLLARRSMLTDGSLREVADELRHAAWSEGWTAQARFSEPKPEEASVVMKREELHDIAWLADYGLRVWTSPGNPSFRSGERLTYEKAQGLADVLDTFERRIVDLVREPEDEKERRFETANDRMTRIFLAYDFGRYTAL